jgi:acyl carrier protein
MDEEGIRALIAGHFGVAPSQAVDTALFQADLGADSLDVIELTVLLENQLGIAIADEEGELCASVGDALRLVREKLTRVRPPAAPAMAGGWHAAR